MSDAFSQEDLNFLHNKRSEYLDKFKKNNTYYQSASIEATLNIENQKKFFKIIAKKQLKRGDLIELSPIIFLGFRARYHSDPVIVNSLFQVHKDCLCPDCKNHGRTIGLMGGYASFYRKSDSPNAIWFDDVTSLAWMSIAVKDIKIGEEISLAPTFKNKSNDNAKDENPYNIPKSEKDLWDFDWSRIPLTPTD